MKRILLIISILLIAISASGMMLIGGKPVSSGVSTVVEWDCTATGLDKYDATDGATITETGTDYAAGGVTIDANTDRCSFVATDGNNLEYSAGTIEFRFDGNGTYATYSRLFQHGDDAGDFCLRRYNSSAHINFEINNVNADFTVTTNLWDGVSERIVRVTWDDAANERKIYINGVQEGSTDTSSFTEHTPDTTTNFYFGTANVDDGPVEGVLSDLKIWHMVVAP